MKKRFSEEQIIGFLKEADGGVPVKELCRQYGFSPRAANTRNGRIGSSIMKPMRGMSGKGLARCRARCRSVSSPSP